MEEKENALSLLRINSTYPALGKLLFVFISFSYYV